MIFGNGIKKGTSNYSFQLLGHMHIVRGPHSLTDSTDVPWGGWRIMGIRSRPWGICLTRRDYFGKFRGVFRRR